MVEKGAGHLLLMGRGEASAEALKVIEKLETRGARVAVEYADVADPEQLSNVLRDIDGSLPLRGVFHAAAVFEDCVSFNLNQERLRQVWVPKVQGAWNLHVQTLDKPLDYFVLFSSVAAFFGNAGQAGYVCANAYLDFLAFFRKGLGLPATAIGWGRLGQVGWAARNREVARHLESIGILGLRTRQALGLLGRLLREGTTHAAILKIDWQRWQSLTSSDWVPGRIRQLVEDEFQGLAVSGIESTARQNLLAAPVGERLAMMESLLRDRLAQVLGTTADNLNMERPVTELGLDSLMGIELRNWIEKELRTNLPSVELLRGPSIARLAELLVQSLNSSRVTEIESSQDQQKDVLEELENLSEEEVDALLAESMGTES